jgi:hypothetical protein
MAKKTCILLLTLVATAGGQTSSDLSAKFSQITAYKIRPDVLMTARFAADGQVCEMALEKRQKTDNGIDLFTKFFAETEVRSLMDDLVPENERGRNLTPLLNGTVDGSLMTLEYTYEKVRVVVSGNARSHDAGYGKNPWDVGYRVIIITWPKRPCGEVQSAAR